MNKKEMKTYEVIVDVVESHKLIIKAKSNLFSYDEKSFKI